MIGKPGRPSTCRACGKPILFIKTEAGKSVPVDPIPKRFIPEEENEKYINEDGEVKRGRGLDWRGVWTTKQTEAGYTDHRTTCPAAEDLKRKKNKSERTKKGGAGREEGTEYPGNYHGQQGNRTGD